MDRAEREEEREVFEGIASVLLSLAVLAELLSMLPLVLRLPVLALLRPAEAVARAFALEWAGGGLALPPATVPAPEDDSRAEALRLALCFRVLALIFGGLQGFASGWRPFRGGPDRRSAHAAPAIAWQARRITTRRAMALCASGRLDTS